MVDPAGAMAMFVLRLAGLLSLENALQNNEANLTDLPNPDLNFTTFKYNLTDLRDPTLNITSRSDPITVSDPDLDSNDLGSSASGLDLADTDDENFDTIDELSTPTTSASATPVFTSSAVAPPASTTPVLRPHTTPTLVRVLLVPTAAPPQVSTSRARGVMAVVGVLTAGEEEEVSQMPRASPLSATPDTIHSHPSGEGSGDTTPLTSRLGMVDGSSPSVHVTYTSPTTSATPHDTATPYSIPGTNFHTSPDTIGLTTPHGQVDYPPGIDEDPALWLHYHAPRPKEEPEEANDELYPPDFDPHTSTSSLNVSTLSNDPPRTTPDTPHLEGLMEDDTLMGIIDATMFAGLEAPPEDVIQEFEYYEFDEGAEVAPVPTLPSRSLVGPVPAVDAKGSIPSPRGDSDDQSSPLVKPRRLHHPRPIPPVYPKNRDLQRSNNPYPYGPRRLPGPYAPLTPNLPTHHHHEPDHYHEEYDYGEDFDYYYDSETETRYEVQTKEPPVLFVFDRPGYSPEAPTTMAPTRGSTPSDPWDCAPRCPNYNLLDWNPDYDVREYPETSWVSTVIISDNRVLAELEGYMRVQDYFYGLNDHGQVLNLSIPFVTQIKLGKHPGVLAETNDFTVSLYVQPAYHIHGRPPTPISNEVLLDDLAAKTVFVHNFEANVWDVTEAFLEAKVQDLMTKLRHNGEAFLDRYYYLASYSRPELYQPVYYELWIYATNFRDPQTSMKTMGGRRTPTINNVTQKTLNKLCRGVECPQFEVLRTYKYGIQKRRYYNGLFASTAGTECEFTTMSVWKGFMPLHLYKHGINSHMEVIEATRPIALVHIKDSVEAETECPQNMSMSLYLPKRLHSNPPVTGYAAPNVRITALNDVIVYAYTVGGYLLDPIRVRRELADMKYRLSEFGECFKDDEYYVVIYDFIVRYHGRQNEIWVVAENCKATHNG